MRLIVVILEVASEAEAASVKPGIYKPGKTSISLESSRA